MKRLLLTLCILSFISSHAQTSKTDEEMLGRILIDPTSDEIEAIISYLKGRDLSPKNVVIHDTVELSNSNILYILSHQVDGYKHYGAVIIPARISQNKLPVILFTTGGDGMNKEFDITQDFNHAAAQFPGFLGADLDKKFIVVIPSFRGQQLIIGDKKYQSEGNINDAFDGATTDALALLNVTLETFKQANESKIAIYGGSRGGTVALLAAARDERIKRVIAVAAPTDMKALYQLYPEQFKLLFFNDLLKGEITEQEARRKFISISPIYFTSQLPSVQLHHDKNDPFVPADFAQKLTDKMTSQGKHLDLYFYNESIHGFWSDKNFWNRVQNFIRPLSE